LTRIEKLKHETARMLADVPLIARAIFDRDAPWPARLVVFLTVAYVLSPIDLIPDFIPVLGMLDELILVPLALRLAWRLMPPELRARYRSAAPGNVPAWVGRAGIAIVVTAWLALAVIAVAA
jgi:uncharacterized membrane protein YkvA (DUF1232 family)